MSRQSNRRAVAAALLVAALGGPAAGQAPNPWRGETAALPTAPAPRAVAAKPTRQLTIGLGFNTVGGLTATVEVRDLPRATTSTAKPHEWVTMPRPLPLAADSPPRFAPLPPAYFLQGQPAAVTTAQVIPASYTRVPDYMPPPAPLPVRPIPPAAP